MIPDVSIGKQSRASALRASVGVRAGTADLPLHGGNVPAWLSARMARLGRVLAEAIVVEYGRGELLRRLAHPLWFQALGCFMGMDWHSSGITTSVLRALKRGLASVEWELGVHVCGGRGRHARRTPQELAALGERTGVDGAGLAGVSRLVAKVDTAAVQDGFDLYLHAFVVTDDGAWAVVQQGMNGETRRARRYHWLSEGLRGFVDEPHVAIDGEGERRVRGKERVRTRANARSLDSESDRDTCPAEAVPVIEDRSRLGPLPAQAKLAATPGHDAGRFSRNDFVRWERSRRGSSVDISVHR